MVETIVESRFWIGGVLLVFQVGLFAVAVRRHGKLTQSGLDPVVLLRKNVCLAFGVAAISSLVGGAMGTIVLLTMWEMDGAGLLPGMAVGVVAGAILAAWNPWLRCLDVSPDESPATAEFKAFAIEHYPVWIPIALAIPAVSLAGYLLLTLDWNLPGAAAIGVAALGAIAVMTLFCSSAVSAVLRFRYSRATEQ